MAAGAPAAEDAAEVPTAEVSAARDATLTAFSGFVGAKVRGSDAKTVGTIADVLFAAAEGRIVYVALSVGGVFGVGERLFAVPWAAFVVDPLNTALSLRFTRAALDGRKGFDKDRWPTAADTALLTLG